MRFIILPLRIATIFFASFLLFSTISINAQSDDYVAVFRLYNQQNQRHIYMRGCDEKNNLVQSGFNYEGVAFYVATKQKRRTMPLHRLLLGNGGHFYTTSDEEMRGLTSNPANKYEAVVGYVASSPQKNTVPLYRLLSGDRHLFTTDEQEKSNHLQGSGNKLEGIAAYVWTSGINPCDGNQPPTSGNFPVIYAGTNFDGAAEAVERDKTDLRDWDGSPHTIRSIRVPDGWFFVLYTKTNFRGKSYNLNSNITFAPGDEWYNKIRSIKVYKGAPPKQPR